MRLLDVFVYGPLLIVAGIALTGPSKGDGPVNTWWVWILKASLIILGAGTMAYNWRNYWTQLGSTDQ